jgi:type I restriction-modification system DNA methylase subunit
MSNKEEAKKEISRLVEKYRKVVAEGKLKDYKEESTKTSFIIPLFRALGWGVEDNDEVHPEEQVSRGRVDYTFKINGVLKFVLEAKPLKIGIDRADWAEQAIGYAWHKGCTWAVLTNFETLKVFNAELKAPSTTQSLLKTIECTAFLDRFDELWLLSRESFEQGLLDKEAEKWHKKSKKIPIDKQLLADFTRFRELLSKNIIKLNPSKDLSEEDVDESVQRILDRLIFIRNCEDRELESKKLLEVAHESSVLRRLRELFSYYDRTYDSKIFTYDASNPKKVHECDLVKIDDEVMREVIVGLYSTKDASVSYDFSAIEADVLGNIYEQYLGHILKKSPKRAKLKESQAHRKEQGIYYTPTYIVDYIVRNTLGALLEKTSVSDIPKIKVLDPACGSGSFLIKAFDVLCEAYMKKTKSSKVTFEQKKSILQNNLYGVDLDPKAVEIAQLNLLLKAAEKGKSLPVLENNIKCGNSLIDDEKVAGERAFKWEKEFPEIMKKGGFDVVVGNPPYVRQEELSEIKSYLENNYEVYHGMADLFVYFFEREFDLLKEDGGFGIIVSNKWTRAGYGDQLRSYLSKFFIEKFLDFGDLKVFADATIYPSIILAKKIKKQNSKINFCKIKTLDFPSLTRYIDENGFIMDGKALTEKEWSANSPEAEQIFKKICSSGVTLEEYVNNRIYRGILTGLNDAFVINEETRKKLIKEDAKSAEIIKPLLSGSEIKKYNILPTNKYLIFTRRGIEIKKYPSILQHLEKFRTHLNPKKSVSDRVGRKIGDYKWYEIQDVIAYYKEFENPKIIWGNLTKLSSFYLDDEGFYVNAPACILPTKSKYVLGVLNSKLVSYFLKSICAERQGGFIEQKPVYVSKVPIKNIEKSQEDKIVKLVNQIITLKKQLNTLGTKQTDARAKLEAEIKKTDAEIDDLVYKIYGITDKERKIIEGSLK